MKRVRRGEGGKGQKAPADQPVDGAEGKLCAGDLGDAGRAHLDGLGGKPRFRAGQPGGHAVWHQRHDKAPVGRHRHDNVELLGKLGLHLRPLGRQKRQRHRAPRPEGQAARGATPDRPDLAVAAEPAGADVGRLDHGLPAADKRPVGLQPRRAVLKKRDVGRGAADIGDHGGAGAGKEGGAGKAGSRPGQHRFHGARARISRFQKRPVALDHHQPAGQPFARHDAFGGGDKPVQ